MSSKYLKDKDGNFIHRHYIIDGDCYYQKWIESAETNPEESISAFLESKDWTWYETYFEVKYVSHKTSDAGKKVEIKVRPMNEKELRKARK